MCSLALHLTTLVLTKLIFTEAITEKPWRVVPIDFNVFIDEVIIRQIISVKSNQLQSSSLTFGSAEAKLLIRKPLCLIT